MARKKKSVESSGKRKTAVARATVKAGKGRVRVNSEPIEILQPSLARRKSMEPLVIADAMNRLSKVDISITTPTVEASWAKPTPFERPLPEASSTTTVALKALTKNSATSTCASTAACSSTTHAERSQSTNSVVGLDARSRSRIDEVR